MGKFLPPLIAASDDTVHAEVARSAPTDKNTGSMCTSLATHQPARVLKMAPLPNT